MTGFRLLHNHAVVDLVTALFPFGSPPFVAMREKLWLDAVDAVLAADLPGLILTFAPERTVRDEFLPALTERVRSGGGIVRFVELRCSPSALESRLTDPSRERFGKLRDVALYRELDRSGVFDGPVMPEAELVIETDAIEPADAARRIAQHLLGVGTTPLRARTYTRWMKCPTCGSEYRPGFSRCTDCDQELIPSPPAEDADPRSQIELVRVFECGNPAVIPLVESLFDDAGIEYNTSSESLQDLFALGRLGTGFNNAIGPVFFSVRKEDEAEARSILATLEQPELPEEVDE